VRVRNVAQPVIGHAYHVFSIGDQIVRAGEA
jgi:hypothetical protein